MWFKIIPSSADQSSGAKYKPKQFVSFKNVAFFADCLPLLLKKRAGVSKLDSEVARPAITDFAAYSQVAAVNSLSEDKSGSKSKHLVWLPAKAQL